MILGMPWWLWLMLAVAAFLVFGSRAARVWRASFRGKFIAYLRREAPEWEVVSEGDDELEVKGPDGATGTLRLQRLYAEGTGIEVADAVGREELFAKLVGAMREGRSMATLDPERDRGRVRPRIVDESLKRQLQAAKKDHAVPAVPLGVEGLWIVFVLDYENSVAYLTDDLLADLKLSPDEALELAKENLRRSMDVGAAVRRTLAENSMSVLKGGDSYDAARILLVPESLGEGEEVAAAIPDRDTLMLALPPADGGWSGLRKLARTPAGDVLWREPLLVRSTGISAVPTASVR